MCLRRQLCPSNERHEYAHNGSQFPTHIVRQLSKWSFIVDELSPTKKKLMKAHSTTQGEKHTINFYLLLINFSK